MTVDINQNLNYNNLIKTADDIKKIKSFSYGCFVYQFYNLKEIDITSLGMKLNNIDHFDCTDFESWMQARKINYLINYKYIKSMTLKQNITMYCSRYLPAQLNAIKYRIRLETNNKWGN